MFLAETELVTISVQIIIARSALYVRRVVKIRCPVRPSARRTTSDDDERIIIQTTRGPQRGGHMPLNSETLKTRFQKNCSKRVKVGLGFVDSSELESLFDKLFAHFEKQVPDVACVT